MKRNEQDTNTIFRRIGCKGLIIFERDGTLLRRKSPLRSLTLGDISNEFASILKELRHLGVCFGFISNGRGMDASSHGVSEFVALTGLIDQLLAAQGAMPDFWISRDPELLCHGRKQRDQHRRQTYATMILRAIEWYCVDKNETVVVSSTTAGLLAANDTGVHYLRLRDNRATLPDGVMKSYEPFSSQLSEFDRLRALIQEILGLGNRRSA